MHNLKFRFKNAHWSIRSPTGILNGRPCGPQCGALWPAVYRGEVMMACMESHTLNGTDTGITYHTFLSRALIGEQSKWAPQLLARVWNVVAQYGLVVEKYVVNVEVQPISAASTVSKIWAIATLGYGMHSYILLFWLFSMFRLSQKFNMVTVLNRVMIASGGPETGPKNLRNINIFFWITILF